MKLSIIIPIFNERNTAAETIDQVRAVEIPSVEKEIIAINDASTDGTEEILEKLQKKHKDLVVITHEKNQGKGAAVRTGFKRATGDYIVIQDADLEYDPKYLIPLMEPIVKKKTQVVYGTRLTRWPSIRRDMSMSKSRFLLHFLGNRFLSLITSVLYLQWITDMETCYKIFPRKFLDSVTLSGEGFNFEPEITAKLIKHGYKIVELPITTKPRGYQQGKKLQTFPEGVKALWTLFKYRFTN